MRVTSHGLVVGWCPDGVAAQGDVAVAAEE